MPAQARLGEIYLTGLEAPATATASARSLIDAPEAEGSLLKRLFPQGLSVHQDPSQAAHWNSGAAQAQDAGAQARLGYQYATGFGVAEIRGRRALVFGRGGSRITLPVNSAWACCIPEASADRALMNGRSSGRTGGGAG